MENDIISKIKSGAIKMKPKYYFALKTCALVLAIIILFLFIIYLTSFILFSVRASGAMFLPQFGFVGIKILTGSLPWLLIFLSVVLVAALEFFAEHLSFVWRRPVIYSLLAVVALVLLGGFLIEMTPFHLGLLKNAQDKNDPPMFMIDSFYKEYGIPSLKNVYNGIVSGINGKIVTIEMPCGESIKVDVSGIRNFPCEQNIKKGDTVVIIGEKIGKGIKALGICKIEQNPELFPYHRKNKDCPGGCQMLK